MICWIFISGLVALPFMMIPYARIVHDLPQTLPMNLNCTNEGTFLSASKPYICEFNNFSSSSLHIKNCTFHCYSQAASPVIQEAYSDEQWCKYTKECGSNLTEIKSSTFQNIQNEALVTEDEFLFDRKLMSDNGSDSVISESVPISIPNFCPNSDKMRENN